MGLAEVLGYVIKFPSIFGKRWQRHHQPRHGMTSTGDPAIVIDAAITKHLKILSGMRRLGVRIVEGITHRGPIKRPLQRPVHAVRESQAGSLQYRRANIGDVSELGANFSLGFHWR